MATVGENGIHEIEAESKSDALQLTTGTDSWLHSLWHVAGALAAGTALYLV